MVSDYDNDASSFFTPEFNLREINLNSFTFRLSWFHFHSFLTFKEIKVYNSH